jgi:hypothetical protein
MYAKLGAREAKYLVFASGVFPGFDKFFYTFLCLCLMLDAEYMGKCG